MTGTDEYSARPVMSECAPTRATMHEVMEEIMVDVSRRDSLTCEEGQRQILGLSDAMSALTPSWMSSLPRNMGCPPISVTAASVDTRVRVLRLLNIMAIVCPARLLDRVLGVWPDLTAVLYEDALRTSLVNSLGLRSAMDVRWRGAELLETGRV
jgi:hypothetical protein